MPTNPSHALGRGLHVLQVGPLYNNHLARWSGHAAALDCRVAAAGEVRPRRQPVDLTGITDRVEVAPEGLDSGGCAPQVTWLRDVIRRLEPDLVHAHYLIKWAYIAVLAGGAPVLATAWGSDVYVASGLRRRRAHWAMCKADGVLARSGHMERELVARGAAAERIHRVDLGVDLERFTPASPREQAQVREELGLPPGPLLLSMRAGTEVYNLDVLLDAFRIVRGRVQDATLVLVPGDAPLSPQLCASLHASRRIGGVRVVGRVSHADMPKYVKAATAAVSIPSTDGSPSSVWEALAGGVPLVLSDLPQIEEKVGRSGAVKLVEPRPEPVASALIELIEDRSRRDCMAQAARAWAVANVDERDEISRLGSVYGIIARRPIAARKPWPAPGQGSARDRARAAA